MTKMIRRASIFLLMVVILTSLSMAVQADSMYAEISADIPVGGNGTFRLIPDGAADDNVLQEITIDGFGVFTMQYDEPDDHEYVIYSTDAYNTARYKVLVRIITNTENELSSNVVVTEFDTGRKVPSAMYPVAVDPPLAKRVTGEKPPTNETFEFEFKAVSTTAEGLSGNMPMPAGSQGQTKAITIVGTGDSEAGEFMLARAGEYVYEFTEKNTGKAGYTYDRSVYRVTFTVTETGEGFHVESLMTKNGVETQEFRAVFYNKYSKTDIPKTGDDSNPRLWMALIGGSVAVVLCAVLIPNKRKPKSK